MLDFSPLSREGKCEAFDEVCLFVLEKIPLVIPV